MSLQFSIRPSLLSYRRDSFLRNKITEGAAYGSSPYQVGFQKDVAEAENLLDFHLAGRAWPVYRLAIHSLELRIPRSIFSYSDSEDHLPVCHITNFKFLLLPDMRIKPPYLLRPLRAIASIL